MNTHAEISTASAKTEARWLDPIKRVGTVLSNTRNALMRSRQRRSAIRELRSLSDHMLLDIGITRNNILEVVDGTLAKQEHPASSATTRAETDRSVSSDSGACATCA